MPNEKLFGIFVRTASGDVAPQSRYDNIWPTRIQAEQEANRRDPPPKGRYIVKELVPVPDSAKPRNGPLKNLGRKTEPNSLVAKRKPRAPRQKSRPKVSRREKGPRFRKF